MPSEADTETDRQTHTHTHTHTSQRNFKKLGACGRRPHTPGLTIIFKFSKLLGCKYSIELLCYMYLPGKTLSDIILEIIILSPGGLCITQL